MANIRIKDLSTTASTTASDDFFGVDGATNGTRKLNAYSPTFGGNVVATGTLTINSTTDSSSKDTGAIITEGGVGIEKKLYVGTDANVGGNVSISGSLTAATNLSLSSVSGYNFFGLNNAQNLTTATGIYSATGDTTLYLNVPTGSTVRARVNGSDQLTVSSTATTIAGNLTVSGTGTSSVAGNLGLGTTSPSKTGGSRTAFTMNAPTGQLSIIELCVNETLQAYAYANANQLTFSAQPSRFMSFETGDGEKMRLTSGGNLLVGTTTDGGQKLQVNGTAYVSGDATFAGTIATQGGTASTPASASATGTAGTIRWDASYIYVCTAANTWKRVAIATW